MLLGVNYSTGDVFNATPACFVTREFHNDWAWPITVSVRSWLSQTMAAVNVFVVDVEIKPAVEHGNSGFRGVFAGLWHTM